MPLAFAPFHYWGLALLSVCALSLLLMDTNPRSSFTLAFSFGLGLFGTGTSWVYVSIHDYGEAPVLLAAALTGVFVLSIALLFALPFILYGMLDKRRAAVQLLAFPALWILGEWFRSWFLTGFPWLLLGYSSIDTWLSGWAPVAGVYSLSGGIALTGASIGLLITNRLSNAAIGGLIMLAITWGGGLYLQEKSWTEPVGKTLSVALVQPDQAILQKWDPDAIPAILDNFATTNTKLANNELVIWPEAAIPRLKHTVQTFLDEQDKLATSSNTALLLGIPIADYETDYYNGVIGLGIASGEYRKQHLVPFGEYIPLERWLRGAIAFFDLPMSAFKSGPKNQTLIHIGDGISVATAICYEIAYPSLVAQGAADANLLLTISNDTWFGASLGPHQHLQMARMRALEHAKPLLRATNDGITAIIDTKGNIDASIPAFEAGVLKNSVTPRKGSTPYVRQGSLPTIVICLVLTVLVAGAGVFRKTN